MSQRRRRIYRRYDDNPGAWDRAFRKQMRKDARQQLGWLWVDKYEWCDLPYHHYNSKKLIHNGRKMK